MKLSAPTLHRLIFAMALPLLAASPTASAVAAGGVAPKVAPSKPISPDNTVIALPLMPVVPPAARLCAARTPSGLGYTMLRPATGAKPAGDATVLVNYVGYLAATGAVFDQGMQSPLQVEGVIPGFAQGLQMLSNTGVIRLCIPAAMGYGSRAAGSIPPNSDLVFQVELLDFRTAAELEEMRKAEEAGQAAPQDATPQQ